MTRLCFIDTETTSLRPDRRAWEVGLIVREPIRVVHPDGPDTYEDQDAEYRWFVAADDLDLGNADVMSLKIGRFYDRHPQFAGGKEWTLDSAFGKDSGVFGEWEVMAKVEAATRGAHLVGAVPNFDAEVLGARMREHDICPGWHHHLIDIEALTVGYLMARAEYHQLHSAPETAALLRAIARPPWKSDDLSAELNITVSGEHRHTALGDAKWCRDIYDTVMGHE